MRSKNPSGKRSNTMIMYARIRTQNSIRSIILPNVRHRPVFFKGFSVSCASTRLMSSSVLFSLLSVCCVKLSRENQYVNHNLNFELLLLFHCHLHAQSNVLSKVIVQLYCCAHKPPYFQSNSVLEYCTLTFHAQ